MAKDFQKLTRRYKEFLETRKEHDIEAQISEAEQIVYLLEKIDSQKAFIQVNKRIQKTNQHIKFLNIFTRAAAILFLPLLIISVVFIFKLRMHSENGHFAIQKISNPSGVRSEVVLPDGSNVWLNAESTISYKIPFGENGRDVNLTGEAFFEVKKDDSSPFHVTSKKVKVTVLGTRFNFKAFPEEKTIEVVLAEGKVKLNSLSSKTNSGIIMKPGDRAVVNKMNEQTKIFSENIEKYIGWHEGKLIFDECDLSEVAKRLERWFGVEVEIADKKILGYQISTTFENESLHQILNMLELASPIKTKLIPAKIEKGTQIKNKEKIIITNKY